MLKGGQKKCVLFSFLQRGKRIPRLQKNSLSLCSRLRWTFGYSSTTKVWKYGLLTEVCWWFKYVWRVLYWFYMLCRFVNIGWFLHFLRSWRSLNDFKTRHPNSSSNWCFIFASWHQDLIWSIEKDRAEIFWIFCKSIIVTGQRKASVVWGFPSACIRKASDLHRTYILQLVHPIFQAFPDLVKGGVALYMAMGQNPWGPQVLVYFPFTL